MNTRNSTSKLNTSKGSVDETKQLRKENQSDYITTLMENFLRYKKSKKPKKSKKAKKSAKHAKNIATKEKPDKDQRQCSH
jgi:hypothetical protein